MDGRQSGGTASGGGGGGGGGGSGGGGGFCDRADAPPPCHPTLRRPPSRVWERPRAVRHLALLLRGNYARSRAGGPDQPPQARLWKCASRVLFLAVSPARGGVGCSTMAACLSSTLVLAAARPAAAVQQQQQRVSARPAAVQRRASARGRVAAAGGNGTSESSPVIGAPQQQHVIRVSLVVRD